MEVKELLKRLKFNYNHELPVNDLNEAIKLKEEITPLLLQNFKEVVDDINIIYDNDNYFLHIYSLFLFAQFREKKAYPLIVEFFSKYDEEACEVTGDIVTEYLHKILASVCNDDITLIKKIISNDNLYEYIRDAAMRSLIVLVKNKKLKRDVVLDYFYSLFKSESRNEFNPIWDKLIDCCLELYPNKKIYNEIKNAFKEGLVGNELVGTPEDVKNTMKRGKKQAYYKLKNNKNYNMFNNITSEIKILFCLY